MCYLNHGMRERHEKLEGGTAEGAEYAEIGGNFILEVLMDGIV